MLENEQKYSQIPQKIIKEIINNEGKKWKGEIDGSTYTNVLLYKIPKRWIKKGKHTLHTQPTRDGILLDSHQNLQGNSHSTD